MWIGLSLFFPVIMICLLFPVSDPSFPSLDLGVFRSSLILGFKKWVISLPSLHVFTCSPSLYIPYFSIFCPQTPHWCLREACSYVEVTAAYAMNMTCAADHTIYSVCASAAAGKNTTTHTCMQTHAHTQKIYMDASCIWSLSSLSSCLKAPWEICKLADAQHCRSYPDPHTGLWLSHPTQTHKRRLTHRLSWRDVYEYLQFSTTHPHKNTPAPEWGWRCVKRKMLTCLLGTKLFLPLSQDTLSWA